MTVPDNWFQSQHKLVWWVSRGSIKRGREGEKEERHGYCSQFSHLRSPQVWRHKDTNIQCFGMLHCSAGKSIEGRNNISKCGQDSMISPTVIVRMFNTTALYLLEVMCLRKKSSMNRYWSSQCSWGTASHILPIFLWRSLKLKVWPQIILKLQLMNPQLVPFHLSFSNCYNTFFSCPLWQCLS